MLIQPIYRTDGKLMAYVHQILQKIKSSSYSISNPKVVPSNNIQHFIPNKQLIKPPEETQPNIIIVKDKNSNQKVQDSISIVHSPVSVKKKPLDNSNSNLKEDKKKAKSEDQKLLRSIQNVYNSINKSRSGNISLLELKESLDILGHDNALVKALIRGFRGKDTGISEVMFTSTILSMTNENKTSEQIRISFKIFDYFDCDYLTKEGVYNVIQSLYSTMVYMRLPVYKCNLDSFVDSIWNAMDINQTGKVYFQEFEKSYYQLSKVSCCLGFKDCIAEPQFYAPKGIPVLFGSHQFSTILQIKLGIRLTSFRFDTSNTIDDLDFSFIDKIDISTSIYSDKKCFFYAYAPKVFYWIRYYSGVDETSFINQFSPEQFLSNLLLGKFTPLRSTISAGASGALFFVSHDRKYIIKTISVEEKNTAKRMLKDYFNYIKSHPNTFLCRLYGLFSLDNIHFIIMANSFHTKYPMDEIYDLKGSKVGRTSDGPIKKDLDFNKELNIGEFRSDTIIQLQKDTIFLRKMCIIDYSLLLGIRSQHPQEFEDPNPVIVEHCGKTPFWAKEYGGFRIYNNNSPTDKLAHLCIIDILTEYGLTKKAERFIKSFVHEKKEISVADPDAYRERFINFIEKVVFK